MRPLAYYNELDPYAAQWLRNLIAAGHIAPGDVDERSILDVAPDDLAGYVQCHFFAGIGVWSHALRLAGWPDDRPVWTGSCPCQPFSVAGVGGGMDDERHLWPYWFHLIEQRRPGVVFGEQVEAAIRHGWLDLVQTDLEGIGYACAAAGIPAAGVGAPHIRSRLWFVADALPAGRAERRAGAGCGSAPGLHGACGLDHHHHQGLEGLGRGHQAEGGRQGAVRPVTTASESLWVANAGCEPGQQNAGGTPRNEETDGREGRNGRGAHRHHGYSGDGENRYAHTPHYHWRDADWLLCRDGKWRPVEPGTFPLAYGAPARVGRLRAYGNAIVPQVAAEVIAAYMDAHEADALGVGDLV